MAKILTDDAFRPRVIEALLIGAVENGVIDPDGKTDAELRDAFCEYLHAIASAPVELNGILDHGPDLLKRARREVKGENFHYAAMYYATWVEHWINWVVRCLCVRKRSLSDDRIQQMIREVNIRGKLSWMIPILGGKPIAKNHINLIQRISDHRNAFIHFKYPERKIDDLELHPPELKKAVVDFERTVQYLQTHDRKALKRNLKQTIKRFSQER